MGKFLFSILFIYSTAIAQDWIKIAPVSYCDQFTIEYKYTQAGYQLRYITRQSGRYKYFSKPLLDINNLAPLSDEIIEASLNYCPMSIELTEIDGQYICAPKTLPPAPFEQSYLNLLNEIISRVDKEQNNCQDVIPLIKLQNQIAQLNQDQLMQFEPSYQLLQIFTGSETDQLIDHYHECAGEQKSQNFLKNLIVLEAKKACLFQKPTGLLSLEEVIEIAEDISSQYPDLGLIGLNNAKDEITKEAIRSLTTQAIKSQVKSLLGPQVDHNNFVANLETIKIIDTLDSQQLDDYTKYIASTDAPLEIIEKGLPDIIKNNFSDFLPKDLTPQQKQKILSEEVTPIIEQNYKQCIQTYKQKIAYNQSFENKIETRKQAENNFCQKNPNHCRSKSCEKKINFAGLDPNIKDLNQIQACLFKGITLSISPLMEIITLKQKNDFKESFSLSDDQARNIANNAYKNLYRCAQNKFENKLQREIHPSFTQNLIALQQTEIDEYIKTIGECAKKSERNITELFAKKIITSMPLTSSLFSNQRKIDFLGDEISTTALSFANYTVNNSVEKCLATQAKRVAPHKRSAALCQPLIEMEAGKNILLMSFSEIFNETNLAQTQRRRISENYQTCADKSIEQANNDLFNRTPHDLPAFLDQEENENYLKNNHHFYTCTKEAIVDISQAITEQTLNKTKEELASQIQDMAYFDSLTPQVVSTVKQCFSTKLNHLQSWDDFLIFNQEDGLTELKQECMNKATEFILPKLLIHETKLELANINQNEITPITLESITQNLQEQFSIPLAQKNLNNKNEVILKLAFQKYKTIYPNKTREDFINHYIRNTQTHVIDQIKNQFLTQIIEKGQPEYDFSDLNDKLSTQCLAELYEGQKKNFDQMPQATTHEQESESFGQEEFIEIIVNGLKTAKNNGRYNDFTNKLAQICQAPSQYDNLQELLSTRVADNFILAKLRQEITSSLQTTAQEQCYEELELQKINLSIELQTKLCSLDVLNTEEENALFEKLYTSISTPQKRNLLDLIFKRKQNFLKQINTELTQDFFNQHFLNDPEILNYMYNNVDSLVQQDPQQLNQLESLITQKLFSQKETNSFTDQFIHNQLIAAIGIEGFSEARNQVEEKINNLNFYQDLLHDQIRPLAYEKFYEKWNYDGIKQYLNWNQLPEQTRSSFINDILATNIYSRFNAPENNEQQQEELVNKITDHILNYPSFERENARQKRKRVFSRRSPLVLRGEYKEQTPLSFADKLANDIEAEVTADIKESLLEAMLSPFN